MEGGFEQENNDYRMTVEEGDLEFLTIFVDQIRQKEKSLKNLEADVQRSAESVKQAALFELYRIFAQELITEQALDLTDSDFADYLTLNTRELLADTSLDAHLTYLEAIERFKDILSRIKKRDFSDFESDERLDTFIGGEQSVDTSDYSENMRLKLVELYYKFSGMSQEDNEMHLRTFPEFDVLTKEELHIAKEMLTHALEDATDDEKPNGGIISHSSLVGSMDQDVFESKTLQYVAGQVIPVLKKLIKQVQDEIE